MANWRAALIMCALNSHWNRIAALAPERLAGSVFVDRLVRQEPWTFVHNEMTGQHVRINGLVRLLVQRLDARTALSSLLDQLSPNATTLEKESIASSLLVLSQHGMISLRDSATDARLQLQLQHQNRQKSASWRNPLAIKIPLLNPDRRLNVLCQWLRPALGRPLLVATVLLILVAVVAAFFNVSGIGAQVSRMASTPQHWWHMLLVYPLLKGLHELAHAITIKRLGGDVHEMGITLLILMPLPYVDASDSWRFSQRSERVLVSAAGMLAEGSLAAVGLLVWLHVSPGILSDFAFAIALTGSVSTLLFNANPLLKFDGYQILQDTLDIPNLGPRSSSYLLYLCRRYLLGVGLAQSPVTGYGERRWLVLYGILSALYRWFITLGIALYLTRYFPLIGVALAMFALYQLALKPVVRLVHYLRFSTELNVIRQRAVGVTVLLVGVGLSVVLLVPVPDSTRAEGVIGLSAQAQLFAAQAGELSDVYVSPGQQVVKGQRLLRLTSPDLKTRHAVVASHLDVLKIQLAAARVDEPLRAFALQEDLAEKQLEYDRLSRQVDDLLVRASVAGQVVLSEPYDRPGQYVQAGTALGYVVGSGNLRVKAVVLQDDVSRTKDDIQHIQIRLAERFWEPVSGVMTQQTPAGNRALPSQALAYNGRSGIAVASRQDNQWKTVDPVFHLEFALPAQVATAGIGGRAYVTLIHQPTSIGKRSWRSLRQMFISQLSV